MAMVITICYKYKSPGWEFKSDSHLYLREISLGDFSSDFLHMGSNTGLAICEDI